ncbi:hypothetical protein BgiMline_000089, partial [Biomphalaria glabrata]
FSFYRTFRILWNQLATEFMNQTILKSATNGVYKSNYFKISEFMNQNILKSATNGVYESTYCSIFHQQCFEVSVFQKSCNHKSLKHGNDVKAILLPFRSASNLSSAG